VSTSRHYLQIGPDKEGLKHLLYSGTLLQTRTFLTRAGRRGTFSPLSLRFKRVSLKQWPRKSPFALLIHLSFFLQRTRFAGGTLDSKWRVDEGKEGDIGRVTLRAFFRTPSTQRVRMFVLQGY